MKYYLHPYTLEDCYVSDIREIGTQLFGVTQSLKSAYKFNLCLARAYVRKCNQPQYRCVFGLPLKIEPIVEK